MCVCVCVCIYIYIYIYHPCLLFGASKLVPAFSPHCRQDNVRSSDGCLAHNHMPLRLKMWCRPRSGNCASTIARRQALLCFVLRHAEGGQLKGQEAETRGKWVEEDCMDNSIQERRKKRHTSCRASVGSEAIRETCKGGPSRKPLRASAAAAYTVTLS